MEIEMIQEALKQADNEPASSLREWLEDRELFFYVDRKYLEPEWMEAIRSITAILSGLGKNKKELPFAEWMDADGSQIPPLKEKMIDGQIEVDATDQAVFIQEKFAFYQQSLSDSLFWTAQDFNSALDSLSLNERTREMMNKVKRLPKKIRFSQWLELIGHDPEDSFIEEYREYMHSLISVRNVELQDADEAMQDLMQARYGKDSR